MQSCARHAIGPQPFVVGRYGPNTYEPHSIHAIAMCSRLRFSYRAPAVLGGQHVIGGIDSGPMSSLHFVNGLMKVQILRAQKRIRFFVLLHSHACRIKI
jgi:hypothetical protein